MSLESGLSLHAGKRALQNGPEGLPDRGWGIHIEMDLGQEQSDFCVALQDQDICCPRKPTHSYSWQPRRRSFLLLHRRPFPSSSPPLRFSCPESDEEETESDRQQRSIHMCAPFNFIEVVLPNGHLCGTSPHLKSPF